MNSARLSRFTALSLKVLGGVLILSALVDYLLAAIPFMPLEDAWQISLTAQLVDRGLTPMIGIVVLLLSLWVENRLNQKITLRPALKSLSFLSLVLSLVLGGIFFLIIPLHLDNLQSIRDEAISRIEEVTRVQEEQANVQLVQLQAITQNPEAKQQLEQQLEQQLQGINEAIAAGQVPPAQLSEVEIQRQEILGYQQLLNNPETIPARLDELREQVEQQRDEQQQQAKNQALREAFQVGLRSLLLGLGYIALGWLGIQTALNHGPAEPQTRRQPDYAPSPAPESSPELSPEEE